MKNKIYFIVFIVFFSKFYYHNVVAIEQFNFDITEIEITNSGKTYKGLKRGTVTTNDGIIINSDKFEFDKSLNILWAYGNVEFYDQKNDYVIFSDEAEYNKNKEIISTKGKTKSKIKSKYEFTSNNVLLLKNEMILSSNDRSRVIDNKDNIYIFDKFVYYINDEFLKGENIELNLKKNKNQQDKVKLLNGFIDLKNSSYTAGNTEIFLHNEVFNNIENEPRLYGVSSNSNNNITTINKGVFTSCKKNDTCPPWSIKAEKIKHNKTKKQLIYDNAFLRVYDIPVLYFPKFFHPDPSVKRQSGFLKPQLNKSELLGTSLYLPYYKVISENKDYTFKPTIFRKNIYMFGNELRYLNKNSSFIADFSYLDGYKSNTLNKKNSISHLFANYEKKLEFKKFNNSEMSLFYEKTTNDTYLKIFENNFVKDMNKPSNYDVLSSGASLTLDHEKYDFSTGINIYENLQKINSDRYQYVLPYYDLKTNLQVSEFPISLHSRGSNTLSLTNVLKTNIINDFSFSKNILESEFGFQNNLGMYVKNINTLSKNDALYKNSPQAEIENLIELNSSLPLLKINENTNEYLTPKISFRINPSDMKNYSGAYRQIATSNIFNINRLGLDDAFEAGRSLTMGINYQKIQNKQNDVDVDTPKFIELNLATVLRDKEEDGIPITSSLNKKTSNIFGSITNKNSDIFQWNYDFSLNNNLNKIDYHKIGTKISVNNFITEFTFIEENGIIGDANILNNTTTYTKDDKNFFSFSTRRNRQINLTEYYDLVYEYKNDCLTAGIKYKKTYYEDRDLRPTEDLLFTITFFPLTTYEQEIDQNFYRN